MRKLIFSVRRDFEEGEIVERPNRFILIVRLGSSTERVYLANPGALSTVISVGRKVLCEPASGADRKTDYNAFAILVEDIYVTVGSTFANTIFSEALKREILEDFREWAVISQEPSFPNHGRADFLLEKDGGEGEAYVEVKSCTHVENGIAKFPDRPTKRGRRHIESLMKLSEGGIESHIVFVVQRPDAEEFQPFESVDPEFSNLLRKAEKVGVNIHALSNEFEPPEVFLKEGKLPVNLL